MNYYYLDAQNRPTGPLLLDEIRRKAAGGEIPANPMIATIGTTQWQPLAGLDAAPAGAGGHPLERFLADIVASAQKPLGEFFSPAYLRASLRMAGVTGHCAVTVGAGLGLAYSLYQAYVLGSVRAVLTGLFSILLLAVAHYTARRCLAANEALVTRTRLASRALSDSAGLLALCAALIALVVAVMAVTRVGLDAWPVLLTSAVTAWVWTCFAAITFHPETIRVEFAPGDAGEESIEAVQFLLKAGLSLVPLAFGVLGALACIGMVLAFFVPEVAQHLFQSFGPRNVMRLPLEMRESGVGFRGLGLLITACLLPLLAHLAYIVASWPLSLWRSLISVSGKLDALKR